jgi:hypothetical protein
MVERRLRRMKTRLSIKLRALHATVTPGSSFPRPMPPSKACVIDCAKAPVGSLARIMVIQGVKTDGCPRRVLTS